MLLECPAPWRCPVRAQSGSRRSQTYWYTVQNNIIVVKTGMSAKPLKEEVTLPNGNHLLPLTRQVVLPTGEQQQLNQDDVVMPSGEIIRVSAPTATASPPEAGEDAVASSFSYLPAAPVNGKLKGVVELGASGFNSFIVRTDN